MARLDRRQHVACGPIAVNVMPGDQLPHERQALDRDLPNRSRRRRPDEALEFRLVRCHTMDRLRSAAARGSPADSLLLEQYDVVAPLGQMQRRRAARDSPAYDAHVAAD